MKNRFHPAFPIVLSLLALVLAAGGGSFATAQIEAAPSVVVPSGTIVAYGGSSAPSGWLFADGSEVSRTQFRTLFQAIGTTYGAGNGSTTFRLPDLRGRVPVGADGSAGRLSANDALGQAAGEEKHTLSLGETPSHAHAAYTASNTAYPNIGDATLPGFSAKITIDDANALSPGTVVDRGTVWIENAGGSQPHNNMPPYQVVNYIIKS
jgi:microcystin-dependent protein